MKKQFLRSLSFATIFLANLPVWAQTGGSALAQSDLLPTANLDPEPINKNRLGLSYRMGLNISVDFRKLGGLALSNPGSATGNTVNRNYDNGYNRVDSSTNSGGLTWYWGYQSAQSVQGDNLVLQSYSTPANATSKNRQDDPQHGFEISYDRELYRDKHWRFGAEAAFGYTLISVSDSRSLKNTAYRTNDTFALNGTIPPLPPYNGTFEGPGSLISSSPSSRATDIIARAATITGVRTVDADLFSLRLGPYFEIPLYKKFSLFFDGGLTLAVGRTEFSYRENVTISDPAYNVTLSTERHAGAGSQTDFLVGGYAGAAIEYALTKEVTLFTGAQFQAAGRSINKNAGKESVLDLGQSILVAFGVSYAF
jgi:hypothetical protein